VIVLFCYGGRRILRGVPKRCEDITGKVSLDNQINKFFTNDFLLDRVVDFIEITLKRLQTCMMRGPWYISQFQRKHTAFPEMFRSFCRIWLTESREMIHRRRRGMVRYRGIFHPGMQSGRYNLFHQPIIFLFFHSRIFKISINLHHWNSQHDLINFINFFY